MAEEVAKDHVHIRKSQTCIRTRGISKLSIQERHFLSGGMGALNGLLGAPVMSAACSTPLACRSAAFGGGVPFRHHAPRNASPGAEVR